MVPIVLWEYGVENEQDPTYVHTDISWSIDPDVWETARKELADIIEGLAPGKTDPILKIKANGEDGPLLIPSGASVSITIALDPGDASGQNADWWIAAMTPFGAPGDWYTYIYPTGWGPGINLCLQTPLFAFSSFEALNVALPAGNYMFYFAIDDPDGAATGPWWGMDSVEVMVQ